MSFTYTTRRLYDAIEQRDVRFRKRMALGRALERLMILDHVLAHREFHWLGAEQDKVAHFLTTTSLDRDALPRLAFGVPPNVTVRHFPDKLPIGVSPDGRQHAFLYLLVSPLPDDFRVFLRRHAELLRALPAWSVQLLVPVKQTDKDGRAQRLAEVYEDAFHQEFGTPLDPVTANELRWFWDAQDHGVRTARRATDAEGAPHLRNAAFSSPAPGSGTRWPACGRCRELTGNRRRDRTRRRPVGTP